MVKVKNKKSKLAEIYAKKRKQTPKTLTPFEIHINKAKQHVLGRKTKADRGLPGIARTRAIDKRKNTLLQEFKIKDKDNIFLDKRIGEKSRSMTQEEKAMARFTAERARAHKKKNIFNLNDEEILTHRGQALMDIEKFDEPMSDDNGSDDGTGRLDDKFVESHFGGGILSKPNEMSRKDLIDKLITESKKRKAEKQREREQNIDKTEQLDTEWKDLMPLMLSAKNQDSERKEETSKPQSNSYDIAVRELRTEARATPGERLKSEEEIERVEKNRLEKLEQERLARMKGFEDDANVKIRHKSADDLDDHYFIETFGEKNENEEGEEEKDKTESEGDEEDEDEINVTINENPEEEGEEENDEISESVEAGKSDDSDEDDLSDLKESESSSEEEEEPEEEIEKPMKVEPKKKKAKEAETEEENLARIYEAPQSFEELETLLRDQTVDQQFIVVDRIIKSNPPKIDGNKEKLMKLMQFLLQYLDELASARNVEGAVEMFQIFDRFCPHLYDLAHISPLHTKNIFHDIVKDKHNEFEKNIKKFPGLDVLILFKLVATIFPASDFRHPIITPCLVFMSQILLRCRIKKRSDLSKGLFLCTLMLEYTSLSKRFCPSAINFLRGVLFISVPKEEAQKVMKTIPPFKSSGEESNLLVLQESMKKADFDVEKRNMFAKDLLNAEIDEDFKLRALMTALNLISEFGDQLQELDAAYPIFEPILKLLETKFVRQYPKSVRVKGKELKKQLKSLKNKKLEYLALPKKRPKALRLYEPRIERVYEGRRHKSTTKEGTEKEKLLHKLKKETKSAIREVRRDTAFLAKVQIRKQIKDDEERKRKVREIFGDAATQQSELKKLKRNK